MKKIISSAAIALTAIIGVSCNVESIEASLDLSPKDTVVIEVCRGAEVRTTLGASYVPLWQSGDKVWVSDGTDVACAEVDSEYDGLSTAKLAVTGLSSGVKYYVAYPFSEDITLDGEDIIIPVPALQDGGFASANIASGTVAAGKKSVVLENRTAILELDFSDNVYSSLEIDSHGSSNICGTTAASQDKLHADFSAASGG